jgi:flagellin-like hook-associated protein FlgL
VTSAFQAAQDLQAALLANDVTAITAAMESLNASFEQSVKARAKVGHVLADLSSVQSAHADTKTAVDIALAELVGVDIAAAASETAFAESVLQTALDTASQLVRAMKVDGQL